jgi:hypothetical protein
MSRAHCGDQLHISVVEIYNEMIYDLLDRGNEKEPNKLGVTTTGETEIQRAVELEISSVTDVDSVIEQTESVRDRGSTELNLESSRSHTVFRIRLGHRKRSCWFSIVDLAGCERLSTMNSSRGSFKEACNIHARFRKMHSTVEGANSDRAEAAHVICDSKLTHLLNSFFEPQVRMSQASIILNVSPSMVQFEDTAFALQFAADAAQSMIRQTRQLLSVIRDEEEEELAEASKSAETKQEMEIRIRSEVEKEMIEILGRQQRHSGATMQDMREIVRSLPNRQSLDELTGLQAANDLVEQANLARIESIHSLEVELRELETKRAAVSCENARLADQISVAPHQKHA